MDHDYRVVLRHFVWGTYILFRRVTTYVRLFVKTFFLLMTQTQQSILLLWSPWELQLRFKARLNQYERQMTELVKKGTNIKLNTERKKTTTTKTKTDKGPQEPNNWSKSSQPMHISLQAMNIFYISLAIYTHNSFSVVQLPSFLKIKVFFFYLKSHCLRKNAAQNIPSGIETKRKLVLVTDKLMPQWLFARKIEKHLLWKFVYRIDYGAITGGGENYHL